MSFYPLVIKTFQTNLFTQVMVRMITFVAISWCFLSTSVWTLVSSPAYLIISILNLVHIYASYIGFERLDVGVSLAIFYLYPLINVIIKSVLITHKYDLEVIKYFMFSLVGVYLIAFQSMDVNQSMKHIGLGVLAIIVATITESLIYTFYKVNTTKSTNPFDMLFSLHFGGAIILIAIYVIWGQPGVGYNLVEGNNNLIWKLVLANMIIGVLGNWLRFYSLKNISTEWFSILSFLEIIIGFISGWSILGEKISKWHLIGSGFIFYSVFQVHKLGYD